MNTDALLEDEPLQSISLVALREQLLAEHRGLRAQASVALRISRLLVARRVALDALDDELRRLADLFDVHNQHEALILARVLRNVDAWGGVRAEALVAEHAGEHRELVVALVAARSADSHDLAARLTATLVEQLLAHMEVEEREVFPEDAFHDDASTRDSFGG